MNEDEQSSGGGTSATVADGPLLKPQQPLLSEADRRRARAAAKLKENLSRRKQQVRARRAGEADETDGLPAAKMDEL
ncbi:MULTISPECIES: hypothetical protein [Rhizobium]|uniref:DUF4169 family protein n=1 Tax=Rhizobium rhododendri TaxID=2506430 RepID=A0ABY8IFJ4_9HYPH|nr:MULTISPECIES: hypothetical protein [Rhizobium]MBO9099880.1 hypothetical protein [Rhizobium sp. L58/93]MBO9131577.1 hypothetical protein [Rhizobium sp. B209b/85]MBO9169869.1 hypothetical protein [Rhizobium sp. L245/93]MBO9185827.1 hypothetical protein [Rhizobium sp. E27B/91]MBZ5759245.1 hypothetical protein [Rhizobium sp. VS19-DR96]